MPSFVPKMLVLIAMTLICNKFGGLVLIEKWMCFKKASFYPVLNQSIIILKQNDGV